jgi:hypothetical protein
MPCPTNNKENKFFTIEDDGDSFQLSLYDGVNQVGGAIFYDDGTGKSFELAESIGRFYGNPVARDCTQQP